MRLKPLIAAVLAAGLLFAPAMKPQAQETPRFISVLDDLPLMEGLVEDAASATVFDTARGRIVEVYASGALQENRVLTFYDETLPQLGWRRVASGVFRREGEALSLEFSLGQSSRTGSTPVLTVGFRVRPTAR
jgi:hypothetical protein